MLYPYLIELRLRGNVKLVTKKLIYDIHNKFGVRGSVRNRPVPHVSLFGPFNTKSIREIIQIMKKVGDNYSSFNYEVSGFGYFEHKKWSLIIPRKKKHAVYLKIEPDSNSLNFRQALAKELIRKTKSKNIDFDSDLDFKFHATLAMKDIHHKFDDIWNYLKTYPIKTKGICYRITLVKNAKIVCEYDFVQKRILDRREALSRNGWQLTEKLLGNNDETQVW
jgi:2'-5' RNA ligase superfamily